MASLTYPIDWAQGVVERWQFLTTLTTAWNGSEQRSTIRVNPHVEFEVELFVSGADALSLPTWLDAHQAEAVLIPYWPDGEGAAPSLTARLLEDVENRWTTPKFTRTAIKATLISHLPAPTATVPQSGGLDYLPAPISPDFQKPNTDAWRRLLEVLDYKTGPIAVLDRSGYSRRRIGLEYLLTGDEIAVARAFIWRRYGRAKPALFPLPNGGTAKARLDADEIEWRWITPETCRLSIGIITLPNEV